MGDGREHFILTIPNPPTKLSASWVAFVMVFFQSQRDKGDLRASLPS